jgi:predicted heme/steroid binding protein
MLDIIMNSRVYDLALTYNWGDIGSIYSEMFDRNRNNLTSAFESRHERIELAIQATIDDLLSQ